MVGPPAQLHFVPFAAQDAESRRQTRAHVSRAYRRRDRLKQVEQYTAAKARQEELALVRATPCPTRGSPAAALKVDPFDVTSLQLSSKYQQLLHFFFAEVGPLMIPNCPENQALTWPILWTRDAIGEPSALTAILAHASVLMDFLRGKSDGTTSLQLSGQAVELLRRELSQHADLIPDAAVEAVVCLLANGIVEGDTEMMRLHSSALQGMLSGRAAAGRPVQKKWLLQVIDWQSAPIHVYLNNLQLPYLGTMLKSSNVAERIASFQSVFEECRALQTKRTGLGLNAETYESDADDFGARRTMVDSCLLALYSKQAGQVGPDADLSSFIATTLLMFSLCQLRGFGRASQAFTKLSRQLTNAITYVLSTHETLSLEASELLLWASAVASRGSVELQHAAQVESCLVRLMSRLHYSSKDELLQCCEKFIWAPIIWTEILDNAVASGRQADPATDMP